MVVVRRRFGAGISREQQIAVAQAEAEQQAEGQRIGTLQSEVSKIDQQLAVQRRSLDFRSEAGPRQAVEQRIKALIKQKQFLLSAIEVERQEGQAVNVSQTLQRAEQVRLQQIQALQVRKRRPTRGITKGRKLEPTITQRDLAAEQQPISTAIIHGDMISAAPFGSEAARITQAQAKKPSPEFTDVPKTALQNLFFVEGTPLDIPGTVLAPFGKFIPEKTKGEEQLKGTEFGTVQGIGLDTFKGELGTGAGATSTVAQETQKQVLIDPALLTQPGSRAQISGLQKQSLDITEAPTTVATSAAIIASGGVVGVPTIVAGGFLAQSQQNIGRGVLQKGITEEQRIADPYAFGLTPKERAKTIGVGVVQAGFAFGLVGREQLAIEKQLVQSEFQSLSERPFKVKEVQVGEGKNTFSTLKGERQFGGLTEKLTFEGKITQEAGGKFFIPTGRADVVTTGKTIQNVLSHPAGTGVFQIRTFEVGAKGLGFNIGQDLSIAFGKGVTLPVMESDVAFFKATSAKAGKFDEIVGLKTAFKDVTPSGFQQKITEKGLRVKVFNIAEQEAARSQQLAVGLSKKVGERTFLTSSGEIQTIKLDRLEGGGLKFEADIQEKTFGVLKKFGLKEFNLKQTFDFIPPARTANLPPTTAFLKPTETLQQHLTTTTALERSLSLKTAETLTAINIPATTLETGSLATGVFLGTGALAVTKEKTDTRLFTGEATKLKTVTTPVSISTARLKPQQTQTGFISPISKMEVPLQQQPGFISPSISPSVPTVPTKASIIPFAFSFKAGKFPSAPKQPFQVQVRRAGKFRTISQAPTFGSAFTIGAGRVQKTLAATFRIRGPPTPRGFPIPSFLRAGKGRTFTEIPSARLSSAGEISAITGARKKKKKKRKGGKR